MIVGWLIPWICFGGAGASAVFASVVLLRRPWFWLRSIAVLMTSALLIAVAIHFSGSNGDGFLGGPECGCFIALMLIGPFHLGFLLILIGSVVQDRQWDANK